MRTITFYKEEEVNFIVKGLKNKEKPTEISRNFRKKYGRNSMAVYNKVLAVRNQLRAGDDVKDIVKRKPYIKPERRPSSSTGIEIPRGITYEGVPKKIELHHDHFRIYF